MARVRKEVIFDVVVVGLDDVFVTKALKESVWAVDSSEYTPISEQGT